MTRYLLLNLSLLLLACAPSRPVLQPSTADVKCVMKFIPEFKSELYNTSVEVVGKHLSGLLLIKKMDDQSQRIVFTNEAGVKFFDFGFGPNGDFKVHQVLKKINRESVIKTFRKDFELMLMDRFKVSMPKAYSDMNNLKIGLETGKEIDYVVTNQDCSKLLKLEKWGAKEKVAEITFSGPAAVPDSVLIRHFNFNMTILMKKIVR